MCASISYYEYDCVCVCQYHDIMSMTVCMCQYHDIMSMTVCMCQYHIMSMTVCVSIS